MKLSLGIITSSILLSCLGTSYSVSANTDETLKNLEVVTVTASKSEQKLNQTPASISVLDEGLLNSINAQHINQVISQSAGAWISRGNGQEHLSAIRSPVLTGAGGCGAFCGPDCGR